jgi:putative oxidoreductase
MKIVTMIARILLGLIFLTFGLNGFLHFIPAPMPAGVAGQYIGALFVSHYAVLVFLLQVVAGVLLLVNRFVPLAIALLGPIVVNILLFHFSMSPEGIPLALITTLLWVIVFYKVRQAFAPLFVA